MSKLQDGASWKEKATHYRGEAQKYRELVATDPDKYTKRLAYATIELSASLQGCGLFDEAADKSLEALQLYWQVAENDPEFEMDVALALERLAALHLETTRNDDAVICSSAAVDIRRKLAADGNDAELRNLASSLQSMGVILSEIGMHGEAVEALRDALNLYESLYEKHPQLLVTNVLGCTSDLADALHGAGSMEEAEKLFRGNHKSYTKLNEVFKWAYSPGMAYACNDLGAFLRESGKLEEAESLCKQAVLIKEELLMFGWYPSEPNVHRGLPRFGFMEIPKEINDFHEARKLACYANDLALVFDKEGETDLARAFYFGSWNLCKRLYTDKLSLRMRTVKTLFDSYCDFLQRNDGWEAADSLKAELNETSQSDSQRFSEKCNAVLCNTVFAGLAAKLGMNTNVGS